MFVFSHYSFFLIAPFFVIFQYFVFSSIGELVISHKQSATLYIALSVFNTFLYILLKQYVIALQIHVVYVLFFLLTFFELYFVFKKISLLSQIFIVATVFLHFVVVRSLIVIIYAIIFKISLWQSADTLTYGTFFNILLIGLLTLILIAVKNRAHLQLLVRFFYKKTQVYFLLSWTFLCFIYFLLNMRVFQIRDYNLFFYIEQLLKTSLLLFGFYLLVKYSMQIENMLLFRKDNERLHFEISNKKQWIRSFLNKAFWVYEVNLTKDIIDQGFEIHRRFLSSDITQYSVAIQIIAGNIIDKSFRKKFLQYTDRNFLLREFYKGNTIISFEYQREPVEKHEVWIRLTTNLVQNAETDDVWGMGYMEDITKEKNEYFALIQQAQRDSLTRLYNKITTEILIKSKLKAGTGTLFFIDIDDFKTINDVYGHSAGDDLLNSIALGLQEIFGADDILGRVGGDEFLAFMQGTIDSDIIKQRAKIIQNIVHSFDLYKTSLSIGICIVAKKSASFDTVYHIADQALLEIKRSGKNQYVVYDYNKNRL